MKLRKAGQHTFVPIDLNKNATANYRSVTSSEEYGLKALWNSYAKKNVFGIGKTVQNLQEVVIVDGDISKLD